MEGHKFALKKQNKKNNKTKQNKNKKKNRAIWIKHNHDKIAMENLTYLYVHSSCVSRKVDRK